MRSEDSYGLLQVTPLMVHVNVLLNWLFWLW
jgi:hypothetical protein